MTLTLESKYVVVTIIMTKPKGMLSRQMKASISQVNFRKIIMPVLFSTITLRMTKKKIFRVSLLMALIQKKIFKTKILVVKQV